MRRHVPIAAALMTTRQKKTDTVARPLNPHPPTQKTWTKKIQRFLVENRKYLPLTRFEEIKKMLAGLGKGQWENVEFITFKDPTLLLVLSILVGELGVDRFVLGDTKNGVLKLFLTLCCGVGLIWWLIDIFKVNEMTLDYNYKLLKDTLRYA